MIRALPVVRDLPTSLDQVGPWFGSLDQDDVRLALIGLVAVAVLLSLLLGLAAAIARAAR